LETLQALRELRLQHAAAEQEHAGRTAELLASLGDATARGDELADALAAARTTADLSLRQASSLAGRLEALEVGRAAQADERAHDWVSRAQVEAMDRLFKDTVETLAARLEQLAAQNRRLAEQQEHRAALGGASDTRDQRLDAKSRAVLGDLERRHNPLRAGGSGGGEPGGGAENDMRGGVRYGATADGGGRGVRIEPGKLRARGNAGGNPFAAPQRRF
jgi:hypothetical protein